MQCVILGRIVLFLINTVLFKDVKLATMYEIHLKTPGYFIINVEYSHELCAFADFNTDSIYLI